MARGADRTARRDCGEIASAAAAHGGCARVAQRGGPQNVKAVDPCAVTYDVALYGCKRTGTAAAYELEIQIPAVSRAEHFHHLARRSSLHELGRRSPGRGGSASERVRPGRSSIGRSDRAAAARAQPKCESIKISSHCGCHRTVVVASTATVARARVRAATRLWSPRSAVGGQCSVCSHDATTERPTHHLTIF